MGKTQLRTWATLVVPLAGPALVLVALRQDERFDPLLLDSSLHLLFVSVVAACALGVALVAGRVGVRLSNPGPVWLALGCVCVGLTMLAHGLITPGVAGRPVNEWVGRSPYLAITGFGLALALASQPRNSATSSLAARWPRTVLVAPAAGLAAVLTVIVVDPRALAGEAPVPHEQLLRWMLTAVDCALLTVLAVLHWRRWRLGHDVVQLALMLAASTGAAALLSLRFGELYGLSGWHYHVYLLAGFGGALYAVWVRCRRTRTVDDVLAATFERDPMAHIVSGYPEALRSLVRAVEARDAYTHGHSERTAGVAVQLGIRLRLGEDTLRAIARGGYLHDVGKIAIPDHILNKPGSLTPEERAVIETHPQRGHELVSPLPDLREALPTVLHHHERWDGTGYPHGLAGVDIPLVARVVAIADVWDALTSDRAYRPGMDPQVALAHIAAGSGTHLQPELVEAFLGLAADWGYVPATVDVDAIEGWLASQTCHAAASNRA